MRRLVVAALSLTLLATTSACRDDFFDPTPGQTGPPEQRVEIIARNVELLPGPENAVRIGFSARDPSAHVRVERPGGAGRIVACPLPAVDAPLPDAASCLPDLPDGVRESISATRIGAIALIREGDPLAVEIRVELEADDRAIALRFPSIPAAGSPAACRDNACHPVIEVLPVRGGALAATARWVGGTTTLQVLEGRILARSFSSTGIPYRVAGQASGPSPITLSATLGAPSEYALVLANDTGVALRDVEIDASWP